MMRDIVWWLEMNMWKSSYKWMKNSIGICIMNSYSTTLATSSSIWKSIRGEFNSERKKEQRNLGFQKYDEILQSILNVNSGTKVLKSFISLLFWRRVFLRGLLTKLMMVYQYSDTWFWARTSEYLCLRIWCSCNINLEFWVRRSFLFPSIH